MRYPINLNGLEVGQTYVESAGLFSGPKLVQNDEIAPKGEKRGDMLLYRTDGSAMVVRFEHPFLDPIPKLVVDGQTIKLVEPLAWYQWLWSALPLLLVFAGGCLGGTVGGVALTLNVRVFRSEMNEIAQYATALTISVIAVVAYLAIAIAINVAIS